MPSYTTPTHIEIEDDGAEITVPIAAIVHAERHPEFREACRIAYRDGHAIRWAYAWIADLPWPPPRCRSAAVEASRPASMPAPQRQSRRDYMRLYQRTRREAIRAQPEAYAAYMVARRARDRAEARQPGIT
jgi:hypothetical protein